MWNIIYADFIKLLIFAVNPKQALQLWKLFQSGFVKFYVWKPCMGENDGLTKVFFSGKTKHYEVYILDTVLKSKYSCWRMSILLHELAHVLQYGAPVLKSARQVKRIGKHGQLWDKTVKTSIKEGQMKTNTFLKRSKMQGCLYSKTSEKCGWC